MSKQKENNNKKADVHCQLWILATTSVYSYKINGQNSVARDTFQAMLYQLLHVGKQPCVTGQSARASQVPEKSNWPSQAGRQKPKQPEVALRDSTLVHFVSTTRCLTPSVEIPAIFSLTCSWALGREGQWTHSATPRRKTTEIGWHTPPLSDFRDKVPAVYSQEADKDSFNVVQKAGFRGHSGEKARKSSQPNP